MPTACMLNVEVQFGSRGLLPNHRLRMGFCRFSLNLLLNLAMKLTGYYYRGLQGYDCTTINYKVPLSGTTLQNGTLRVPSQSPNCIGTIIVYIIAILYNIETTLNPKP